MCKNSGFTRHPPVRLHARCRVLESKYRQQVKVAVKFTSFNSKHIAFDVLAEVFQVAPTCHPYGSVVRAWSQNVVICFKSPKTSIPLSESNVGPTYWCGPGARMHLKVSLTLTSTRPTVKVTRFVKMNSFAFFSLRHFGHFSHNSIKTRRNNID